MNTLLVLPKKRTNTFHSSSSWLHALIPTLPKENIIFLMACKTGNIMSKNATAERKNPTLTKMIANKRETAANYSFRMKRKEHHSWETSTKFDNTNAKRNSNNKNRIDIIACMLCTWTKCRSPSFHFHVLAFIFFNRTLYVLEHWTYVLFIADWLTTMECTRQTLYQQILE